MRHKVRITESEIHRIVKESVRRIMNEAFDNGSIDKFTKDMNRLFNVVSAEIGAENIQNTIAADFFDFDRWDNESKIVPCRYSEKGMYSLLYGLCNYDIICINERTVDVKNSNNPHIARLVKPYVNDKMCYTIYSRL